MVAFRPVGLSAAKMRDLRCYLFRVVDCIAYVCIVMYIVLLCPSPSTTSITLELSRSLSPGFQRSRSDTCSMHHSGLKARLGCLVGATAAADLLRSCMLRCLESLPYNWLEGAVEQLLCTTTHYITDQLRSAVDGPPVALEIEDGEWQG